MAKAAGIVARDGTRVTGLTRHGVHRVIGDNAQRKSTKPGEILEALKKPLKIVAGVDTRGRPFKIFAGQHARVVVNPDSGKIVSTNPVRSSRR